MSIQQLVDTIEQCEEAELDYGTIQTLGKIRREADKQDERIAELEAKIAHKDNIMRQAAIDLRLDPKTRTCFNVAHYLEVKIGDVKEVE